MVLDAVEDINNIENEYEEDEIPILNRHLVHRDELERRITSKEEILRQRQEMLEEEITKENEDQNPYEEGEDAMNEENYDYSTAFIQ